MKNRQNKYFETFWRRRGLKTKKYVGQGRKRVKKVVINALQYKRNSSGIGVMIRDLFGPFTALTKRKCQIVVPQDAPELSCGGDAEVVPIPCDHGQALRRIWFQTVQLGRRYGKNAVLLVTDSKLPLFLPKSCVAVPLVTDLAVYRMPEVYQASRVLLWKLQYRYVKRRADFFLAISEFTKSEMITLLGIPAEKIHVVPCACSETMRRVTDPDRLRRLRETYRLPERFVLFVGNNNPRKNLERMLRAFDRAKAQGLPHQLVIAGEQGWKFDREAELKELQSREEIHFIGFVPDEDMSALYSAAELFLFPTLYEGFGIPVVEAQRCGTPVVTSGSSSLPEIGGEGALYVDPLDAEDICGGMLKVLGDRTLAEKLVKAGYENAKRFSWQRSAERLNEIIEREVQE